MIDLSTQYLGLRLRTPLVPSASPLSQEISSLRRLEDSGASAVVLYSLFEEQLRQESLELDHHLSAGTESFAESLTYFPQASEFRLGPEGYLEHIRKAKEALNIPVIASLNGATVGGWAKYARLIQEAGADALECNIYYIPTNPDLKAAEIEQTYVDIVWAVKSAISIPVAVKLSPFFTNIANVAKRLDDAGADGLVLFNRFYQPDIDLDELEIRPNVLLSTPQAPLALDVDRCLIWPPQGESRSNKWSTRARGRNQAADGRRRRHHAVFLATSKRHQSPAAYGTRHRGVDGTARVRIGKADARQHEPAALPRPERIRTRPVYACGKEPAARHATRVNGVVGGLESAPSSPEDAF